MRIIIKILFCFFIIIAAYLLLYPVPIDPVKYIPSENPGMTGPYAQNNALSSVDQLIKHTDFGPEDVTKGPDGFFYTGLQNGSVIRFEPDKNTPESFVNTGGRPLGMGFDSKGNLIVADAFKGILSIAPDKTMTVLTDSVNGEKLLFPDDLDIAKDDTIWFSDASQRFDLHQNILDFLECRPTGRLLSYNPGTKDTKVHLENLLFSNGVALGPDETFVLVNETLGAQITRLWLKGPRAGQTDVFISGLPAYPDNISFNGKDIFWVALPSPRSPSLEGLWPHPFLRKILMRLPQKLMGASPSPYGWVIGLNLNGEVVHNFQDPGGSIHSITSVNEYDGKLYLGSIAMSSVGLFELP